jgi:hypothetical protein
VHRCTGAQVQFLTEPDFLRPPTQADEEKTPVLEKLRRLAFHRVTNKLQLPADDEKRLAADSGRLLEDPRRERYLRTDELLSLQKTASEWRHRDELLSRRSTRLPSSGLNWRAKRSRRPLAERLLDWDERLMFWRGLHLKMVERIIGGHVIGTQGTPVEVLAKRIDVRYFPALWDVRNDLTMKA